MKVLLLTPPMTQVNSPYPATAYLTGFIKKSGYGVTQADPALELFLKLLSRTGLSEVIAELQQKKATSPAVDHLVRNAEAILGSAEEVICFLQGKNPTLAYRISRRGWLPEGPRFRALNEMNKTGFLDWALGTLSVQDRAKHLASLFVDDICDAIRDGIDPGFELSKYSEKLAASSESFDPIIEKLNSPSTLVEKYLDQITADLLQKHTPGIIGISVPFPGNVYGAFRMAREIKRRTHIPVVLGGGYVNTELRSLKDPRVFDFVDFITLDDGQRPFLSILESLQSPTNSKLLRTFVRENGVVVYKNDSSLHDIPMKDSGLPTYTGLPLEDYPSLVEFLNPMHRLWSDGRWNKLTLAQGCYWKKCAFCDTSLDYINRYEPQGIDLLMDRIQSLVNETGQTGFHFVDEAAPPALLKAFSEELISRKINITWWVNIRFEKTFDLALTQLMAKAGCIAVSGGLEVASDRLLKRMEKGVTVEQVARVTHAFSKNGIMVHAYLMYGFPTETEQETIDALERVRQLFEAGCLDSAFWHRFSATAHSPVGMNPEKYGITVHSKAGAFANNDLAFTEQSGCDHGAYHAGLRKAVYNYMMGMGMDQNVASWFDFDVPNPKVPKSLIRKAVAKCL